MAQIKRVGFGQVEPNHLSAQKTGQIYAQLPAKKNGAAIAQLEQGQFLKYNYAGGYAGLDGAGEWMLVYVEEKLYDPRKQMHKDFCLKASDFSDGLIYPRLLKTNIGDIFTTNTFGGAAGSDSAEVTGIALVQSDYVKVDTATGFLAKGAATDAAPLFQVVKVYTMPDGQPGVKLQRVK